MVKSTDQQSCTDSSPSLTVKGFIIGRFLELARKELDEPSFQQLEQDIGVSYRRLRHSFFADYPVQLQMAVEERVSRVLWNQSYEEAIYRIGRINFDSFRNSVVGRTTLALIGKNPRRVLLATVRLVSTVVKGQRIEVRELGEREISVRFFRCPHLPDGWKGTIDAAIEHAGGSPRSQLVRHGSNDFELVYSWT